jgi:hypothetical protein
MEEAQGSTDRGRRRRVGGLPRQAKSHGLTRPRDGKTSLNVSIGNWHPSLRSNQTWAWADGGVALFWAEGGAPTVKNCTSPLDYVNFMGAWASSVPNVASPV